MKEKVNQMKKYLEQSLNHYVENDQEKEMLAVQDICMEFFNIFET